MGIIIPFLLIAFSCLVIWRASNAFELAADYLGRNMKQGVKGATINAVASSMPEFLATVFFLFYLKDVNGFSGGIGITSGSAIYNLLVIPAGVILIALFRNPKKEIVINKSVIYRDGLFLLITTFLLILILNSGVLNFITGGIMVLGYILYILFLFFKSNKSNNKQKEIVLSKYIKANPKISDLFKLNIETIVLRKNDITTLKAWLLLSISTVVLSFGTFMLVQGTEWLGADEYSVPFIGELNGLNIPILFVALILAAAASSLPDTIISFKDAVKGNYDDAFSNVFGSNIFNITFALGMPLFLFTLIYGPIKMSPEVITFSLGLWEILLYLTVIMILIFAIGKKMTKFKAFLMLFFYFFFLFITIGLVLGIDEILIIYNFITSFV